MFNRKHIKIEVSVIALLSFMFLSATAFGQSTSAVLSGTVQDATGGVLVGATVTARNADTGVETRVTSNDRGVYNFPSLQPGSYEISSAAAGLAPARANVRLSAGIQSSLNLTMTAAGTVTEVQVTGVAESVTLEASASTGNVFQEDIIQAVPILSNNAMESINLMGGVTRITTGSMTWNANEQQVAGVAAPMINVTRDGISVNEVRNPIGIAAASNVNQEVVGEMRIILSPVDAELGRGAGQVQMTTRSGSNAFRGSLVWNVQNTALDAEDFSAKQSGNPPNWRNLNNYMITLGGPIIKNRTFFFVNWEQQFNREKITTIATVLTPCARRGIYRYLSSDQGGWVPAAISPTNSYDVGTGNMRSVNENGSVWEGGTVLNSSANNQSYNVTGVVLNFESVFGPLSTDARNALSGVGKGSAYDDCSAIDPFMVNRMNNTTAGLGVSDFWTNGVYNSYYDRSGYVDRFTRGVYDGDRRIVDMPPPNYYLTGDGLNYAGHQWTKSVVANMASIWGGGDPDRKSITARFDHNINSEHRLSGTFNWEYFNVADADRQWPEEFGAYMGTIDRIPYGFTLSATSTLRPTLLNEARFGLSRSDTWTYAPLEGNESTQMRAVLQALLPTGSGSIFAGTPVEGKDMIVGVGTGALEFTTENGNTHPYGSRGNIPATWGGSDPRWTISDTVTWMKGAHSFKGGVEYRRQSSRQDYNGSRAFGASGGLIDNPVIRGGLLGPALDARTGSLSAAKTAGLGWANIYSGSTDTNTNPNGNYEIPYAMMTYFAGSLRNTSQYFYAVPDANSPYLTGSRWNDPTKPGENVYSYTVANQEFSAFFKDDWKITNDVTLNLGVRFEYYGVPNSSNGRTLGLIGGGENIWGITKGGFDHWMKNRNYVIPDRVASGELILPNAVTEYQYIGPGSSNSDKMIWNRDLNNFAPHIGFAWQLPWFGRGQTTLRGGWSMSYSQINDFNMYGIMVADVAAANTSYVEYYNGGGRNYMDIMDLPSILPIQPAGSVIPLGVRQLDSVEGSGSVVDQNIRNPYVHSLNMSVTRNIGRLVTVDVRYIGTLGRNQISTIDLNAPNYISNNLYNEFEIVRRGGQSDLINSIIPPNSLWRGDTGSDQLRSASSWGSMGGGGAFPSTDQNLALGQFQTVTAALASTNGILGQNNPNITSTTAGMVARSGCLPEHRDPATGNCTKGTPLNYFLANPQFGGGGALGAWSYWLGEPAGAATMYYNSGALSNYHSMQTQVTLRPTRGLNFQATYTWSRNLSDSGWTNYLSDRDYVLSNQHRSHMLTTFGTYELPFGANGFLFRDASGVFKKAIEGWQLSWITSMTSGQPLSVTGTSSLWGSANPVLVRPDLWNNKGGKASWDWDRGLGNYFGDGNDYIKVLDKNICRAPGVQSPITGMYEGLAPSLYNTYCASTFYMPYALALATRDSAGNIVADTYKEDYLAADGVMYKAGEDIIIFRNADQRDGAYAMGNYKAFQMTAQGIISFDLAMSKSVEFMEGKRFEIRIDAQNILNHPTPVGSSPGNGEYGGRFMSINAPANMDISTSGTIGELVTKAGHRTFQARLRFSF